jgi:hypothetical protein
MAQSTVSVNARPVAHAFSQREGIDYSETFSPLVKLNTLRTVLAIAPKRNMHMRSADIETTFLNVDLLKGVYMRNPEGQRMERLECCA